MGPDSWWPFWRRSLWRLGPWVPATVVISVLPQIHACTHTHTQSAQVPRGRCPGSCLHAPSLGCHGRLDQGMANVPPTLTAVFPTWERFQSHLTNLMSPWSKKQYLGQVLSPWPCLSLSLCLCASFFLPRFFSDVPPFPNLIPLSFPHYSPGSSGAGGRGCTYKPEPLFDNLFLSSSCWQAAGEEQKVNEALCSGLTARTGGRRAGEPAAVTGN